VNADIKANGSDLPITVSSTEVVSITVTLDPMSFAGREADWWIGVHTSFDPSFDWYTFACDQGWGPGITQCLRAPLFRVADPYKILNKPLPEGDYLFIFGVDASDAAPSGPWWGLDRIAVTVRD